MTIDKAIKYQEGVLKTLPVPLGEKEKDAVRLGIEALKRLRILRLSFTRIEIQRLLPGETGGE